MKPTLLITLLIFSGCVSKSRYVKDNEKSYYQGRYEGYLDCAEDRWDEEETKKVSFK